MLPLIGAAISTIDAIASLTSPQSSSAKSTGLGQASADLFDLPANVAASASSAASSNSSGCSQISPATMSALLAAQGQSSASSTPSTSPSAALQDLFSQIDGNGDGQITKSEFETALGAGGTNIAAADDVFNKLDANGDGSVSLDEMSSALKGASGKGGHHHHHVASSEQSSGSGSGTDGSSSSSGTSDPLLQALAGASGTSVINSDGSITTSLTYADGSKVTLTSPAASASSSTATSSYNLIEQMIQREANAVSLSASTPSLSVSV